MKIRALSSLLLLLALTATAAQPKEDEDPKKAFLVSVGGLFKAGKAADIAKYFPAVKKVELRLRGVKAGRYRGAQARSLLTTYLTRTVEPLKYKLKEVRGSVGKYETEYRIRADGRRVKGTTCVYLEEKDGGWLIVGIVEY